MACAAGRARGCSSGSRRARRGRAVHQDITGTDPFLNAVSRNAALVAPQVPQQHQVNSDPVVAPIEIDSPPGE
jgi:hypothetical protein